MRLICVRNLVNVLYFYFLFCQKNASIFGVSNIRLLLLFRLSSYVHLSCLLACFLNDTNICLSSTMISRDYAPFPYFLNKLSRGRVKESVSGRDLEGNPTPQFGRIPFSCRARGARPRVEERLHLERILLLLVVVVVRARPGAPQVAPLLRPGRHLRAATRRRRGEAPPKLRSVNTARIGRPHRCCEGGALPGWTTVFASVSDPKTCLGCSSAETTTSAGEPDRANQCESVSVSVGKVPKVKTEIG